MYIFLVSYRERESVFISFWLTGACLMLTLYSDIKEEEEMEGKENKVECGEKGLEEEKES